MLDTTQQTNFNDYFTQLRELDEELNGNKFEFDIRGYWGIQLLKMEIPSTEPNIKELIEFLDSKYNDVSIWSQIEKKLGLYTPWKTSEFSDGDWKLNDSGHYECVIQFDGSFWGIENKLFNFDWFKNVDVDFYFDTRRKLGHTSYRWNGNSYPSEKVRYFVSKSEQDSNTYREHQLFEDYIKNPESFSDLDCVNGGGYRSQKVTHEGYRNWEHKWVYREKKENLETIRHEEGYTLDEFNSSFSKLTELNTVIRPQWNELDEQIEFKYNNCVEGWIRRMREERIRHSY